MEMTKPLGKKAYGSIPHLPNSRMGPADHSCHSGQMIICCKTPRDKHDRVIVTEKLDGSCSAVAKVNGEILALGRAGYLAESSPFEHVRMFSNWVKKNNKRFDAIPEGWRIVGEWMAMAHGTIYDWNDEPFMPFDVFDHNGRIPFDDAWTEIRRCGLITPCVIHDGRPIAVDAALRQLGSFGRHGAKETIEGAVWRVERKGKFDFLAKWVSPHKVDGKYVPEFSGGDPVWLWPKTEVMA